MKFKLFIYTFFFALLLLALPCCGWGQEAKEDSLKKERKIKLTLIMGTGVGFSRERISGYNLGWFDTTAYEKVGYGVRNTLNFPELEIGIGLQVYRFSILVGNSSQVLRGKEVRVEPGNTSNTFHTIYLQLEYKLLSKKKSLSPFLSIGGISYIKVDDDTLPKPLLSEFFKNQYHFSMGAIGEYSLNQVLSVYLKADLTYTQWQFDWTDVQYYRFRRNIYQFYQFNLWLGFKITI